LIKLIRSHINLTYYPFSQDCMKWCMLPILADSRALMCRSLSGRFIGDPTYEYEYIDMKVVGEGEEAEEETNTVSFMPAYFCILLSRDISAYF